jgi:hypothetical protein
LITELEGAVLVVPAGVGEAVGADGDGRLGRVGALGDRDRGAVEVEDG